jgi:hypothetical protein
VGIVSLLRHCHPAGRRKRAQQQACEKPGYAGNVKFRMMGPAPDAITGGALIPDGQIAMVNTVDDFL